MEILQLNIKILQLLGIWPEKRLTWKNHLYNFIIYISVYLCGYSCVTILFKELYVGIHDMHGIVEGGIGVLDTIGMIYMRYCFLTKLKSIKHMIVTIQEFEKFCPRHIINSSDKDIRKYTTGFMTYATVGNLLNIALSYLNVPSCLRTRDFEVALRDPCGTIIRGHWPFRIEYNSFLHWLVIIVDIMSGAAISFVAFGITTLLLGILVHTLAQLKHCGQMISECCMYEDNEETTTRLRFCIKSQMLLHITLTSFVLSVISFEILTSDDIEQSVRYSLQLFGWSFFLYTTCAFVQEVINESQLIGFHAYSTPWYKKPASIRRSLLMVIIRSQKPFKLCAANLGVISLGTFLMIMKSAYSYFTLFLNMKEWQ